MNKLLRSMAFVAALTTGGSLAVSAVAADGYEKDPVAGVRHVPRPIHHEPQGEKCVAPTSEMRRNHMEKILHQRDQTMHQGIRTAQYSLKNCVDCHADPKTGSVLGKEGFCESCHRYAAVQIDCFSCHSAQRDAKAETAPARALTAAPRNHGTDSAKGNKP
ncbi:MAG: hypothetical protein OEV31_02115 [Gammaproteobacteria bacterium]|nr:hypothetical protein [Gammaproteobacteria bacterium]